MNINWLAPLIEALAGKSETIEGQELRMELERHLGWLETADRQALLSAFIPDRALPRHEYLELPLLIKSQLAKMRPEHSVTLLTFNSLLVQQGNSVVSAPLDPPSPVHSQGEFRDILGDSLYRKILLYGATGLLDEKFEEKPVRKYQLYQWVQNSIDFGSNDENLYARLLKEVWSFKFMSTSETIEKIKVVHQEDCEIAAVESGLNMLRKIERAAASDGEARALMGRNEFVVTGEGGVLREELNFAASYFGFVRETLTNPYYRAIALFLGNREDNYIKTEDPTIAIEDISIVDRFLYARKFYRSEDFEHFKTRLTEGYTQLSRLEDVLLFGTRKESEVVLQNYIDRTNDIEGAAVVSVYLKLFVEQGRLGLKEGKMVFYSRLIKYYEYLLMNLDAGISKHRFDQKCLTMEVERKKKTMNKTFSFNCLNCGNGQCLLSVAKRITSDNKQHQLRMKGNNYFSKDTRAQLMYCLDCMYMLPKCAVCLFPISVFNGYAEELRKTIQGPNRPKHSGEGLGSALVWCPQCFHGGHLNHILSWLEQNDRKCPVHHCKCRCEL